MAKQKIIFLGSGPVAAASLTLLLDYQEVEAVITKPATLREMEKAVPGVPIFSVGSKKDLDILISNSGFSSRLAVLIDFGIIVSKKVIDSFEKGIINSHFSLLPQWRGADPISFSILSGQTKTGVSLMLLDEGMDTGKILTQKSLPITDDDTTPTLTDKLINLSDNLLQKNLPLYFDGKLSPRQQSHSDRATYSRKLAKKDGVLDFTKPASLLEREIRAFIDWPRSRTEIAGKDVVVLAASSSSASGKTGEIFVTEDKKIGVYCKNSALLIGKLKPAGKKEMTSQAFLAGHRI